MKTNNSTKETKQGLERKISNSLLFVPKDKDYKGVYFDDKGIKLEVTQDFAVISTMYHRHVFSATTAHGISRPYLYTSKFVDIANETDCVVKDTKGRITRSYSKLMSVLKEEKDQNKYNLCWFYDLWLNNIFNPLYGIDETEAGAFLVYEEYLHNIARNQIILSEKKEDMTNRQFVEKTIDLYKKFFENIDEQVIFHAMPDEEKVAGEIDALREQQEQKTFEDGDDGRKQH